MSLCICAAALLLAGLLSEELASAQTCLPRSPGVPQGAFYLHNSGGVVIANAKIFNIYWGSGWNTTTGSPPPATVKADTDSEWTFLAPNPSFYSSMRQYSTGSRTIGAGSWAGSRVETNYAFPAGDIYPTDILQFINYELGQPGVPQPSDANVLYVVYLPSGHPINGQAGTCAYHSFSSTSGAHFAVIPWNAPGDIYTGCHPGTSVEENASIFASHEMSEAITDAEIGSLTGKEAWYVGTDPTIGENGDLCAGANVLIGPYKVQREWSNADNCCLVTRPWPSISAPPVSGAPSAKTMVSGKTSKRPIPPVASPDFSRASAI